MLLFLAFLTGGSNRLISWSPLSKTSARSMWHFWPPPEPFCRHWPMCHATIVYRPPLRLCAERTVGGLVTTNGSRTKPITASSLVVCFCHQSPPAFCGCCHLLTIVDLLVFVTTPSGDVFRSRGVPLPVFEPSSLGSLFRYSTAPGLRAV